MLAYLHGLPSTPIPFVLDLSKPIIWKLLQIREIKDQYSELCTVLCTLYRTGYSCTYTTRQSTLNTHFSEHQPQPWNSLPTKQSLVGAKLDPLRIYFSNLDQLIRYPTRPFRLNQSKLQHHAYLQASLQDHIHMATSLYFLVLIYFSVLLQIQINMRTYKGYIQWRKDNRNGPICFLRNYICLLVCYYIYGNPREARYPYALECQI